MKFRDHIQNILDCEGITDEDKLKAIRGLYRIRANKEAEYEPDIRFRGLFVWMDTSEGCEFWGSINGALEAKIRKGKQI